MSDILYGINLFITYILSDTKILNKISILWDNVASTYDQL